MDDIEPHYDSLRRALVRYGVFYPFDFRAANRFNRIIDIYLDYYHEPFHKYAKVKEPKCYLCAKPVVRLQAFGNRKFCCFDCKVKRNKLYAKTHPKP